MPTRRFIFMALSIVGFCLLIVLFARFICGGVKFTIINAGNAKIVGANIAVSGHDYNLGDINVGESKSVVVVPSGESHVDLQYRFDVRFVKKSIDVYVDNGIVGVVVIEARNDNIFISKNTTHIGLFR